MRPEVVKEFLLSANEHRVVGGSMRPSVRHGQKITLSPLNRKFIIGHIYIFLFNNRLLMHRLIAVRGQNAYFMGDHSVKVEKISVDAIIAEYKMNYHYPLLPIINFINTLFFLLGGKRGAMKIVQMLRIACISLLSRGR